MSRQPLDPVVVAVRGRPFRTRVAEARQQAESLQWESDARITTTKEQGARRTSRVSAILTLSETYEAESYEATHTADSGWVASSSSSFEVTSRVEVVNSSSCSSTLHSSLAS